MKQDFIIPQVDKVSVPSENEDQRILKAALMRLEGGKRWCKHAPYIKDRVCSYTALSLELGLSGLTDEMLESGAGKALWAAARIIVVDYRTDNGGEICAANNMAKHFADIEALYGLAITLAGHPTVKS